jgi:hypothetical protein
VRQRLQSAKVTRAYQKYGGHSVVVEPDFCRTVSEVSLGNSSKKLLRQIKSGTEMTLSPSQAANLASNIIHKISVQASRELPVVVTNANEILTKEGIHGKVA